MGNKRGRPTKLVTLTKWSANKYAPVGELSDAYGCLGEDYGVTPTGGITAKLGVINDTVEKAFTKAQAARDSTARKDADTLPWMTAIPPLQKVQRIKQQLWVAQRIAESLENNLVETMLVITSLNRRLVVANAELEESANKLPKGIEDFARLLHKAGLLAGPLSKLSNDDIKFIAEMIDKRIDSVGSDPTETSRPARRNDPKVGDKIVEDALESVSLADAARPVVDEVILPSQSYPPVPMYGETWNDPVEPVPAEFWDSVIDVSLPYRWEYREATNDEANSVLNFPFPERDSWDSLREHHEIFRNATKTFDYTVEKIEEMARQIVGFDLNTPPSQIPLNWAKAWVLLMWARHNHEAMLVLLGDQALSYFDGVALPIPSIGGMAMRELKPVRP